MADDVASLTLAILRDIRDEAKKTNERLERTNEHLDNLTGEVHELRGEVHELRGEVHELRGDMRDLRGDVRELQGQMGEVVRVLQRHEERLDTHGKALHRLVEQNDALAGRIDHLLTGPHRHEHDELKARVERIEQHLFNRTS